MPTFLHHRSTFITFSYHEVPLDAASFISTDWAKNRGNHGETRLADPTQTFHPDDATTSATHSTATILHPRDTYCRGTSVKHTAGGEGPLGLQGRNRAGISQGPKCPQQPRRQALQERWDQPYKLHFALGGPGLCLPTSSTPAKWCQLSGGQGTKAMTEWSSQASLPMAPLGSSLNVTWS